MDVANDVMIYGCFDRDSSYYEHKNVMEDRCDGYCRQKEWVESKERFY